MTEGSAVGQRRSGATGGADRVGTGEARGPAGSRSTPAPTRAMDSALVTIWLVWGALVLIALLAVASSGRDIPFAEDWLMVPPLTGNEPSLLQWLATPNSEHLVTAPKAVYLLLLMLAGGDFRIGMFVNVLLLGAAAAGLMVVARRVRGGGVRLTDVIFPIAILHLGHWDNLIWSWQLQFVLSVTLICALLGMVIAWPAGPVRAAPAAAAVGALLLLPLSGANGVIMAPAFAGWMLAAGVLLLNRARQGGARKGVAVTLIGSAVVVLGFVAVYLIGYERQEWNAPSPSVGATAVTGARFIAAGFGPAAQGYWMIVATIAALALALAGMAAFGSLRSVGPGERLRLGGLLLTLGAAVALAAAMGMGRAARVVASGSMSPRYALLAVPLLIAAYFAAELYGTRRARVTSQGLLVLLMLALLPLNSAFALERRAWFHAGFDRFEVDLAAGEPIEALADRHYPFLMPWNRDALAANMSMLQQARLGPWRD